MKTNLIAAAAVLALTGSGWVAAQQASTTTVPVTPAASQPRAGALPGTAAAPMAGADNTRADRGTPRQDEKNQLEQLLKGAKTRADYAQLLEKNGYRISSINADRKDYLEYEVVKGDHSYEVQLDFDDGAMQAKKIDVTNNLWRTDATKRMLADSNYKHAGPLVADTEGRYSDRRYMKSWSDEKEKLEKALTPNMKVADIKPKLEQLGYQVTSTNDKKADYVEYEIVKGDNSYEVQVDVDAQTKVAKKVDVTTNVWETDRTERAKGEKGAAAMPARSGTTNTSSTVNTGSTTPMAGTAGAGVATAAAAESPAMTPATAPPAVYGDERQVRDLALNDEKDRLEQALRAAQSRADYAKLLEQRGYRISSINADRADYLEYEIVKDNHSYEVQLDFDNNAPKATKIDVVTNMWRTDATKRMLADSNYQQASPLVADPQSLYSDRRYMKAWTDEKEKLEKALTPSTKVADIRPKLEQMGYQVTSVNDKKADYVEYEIVKGDNSYEVQVNVDPATKVAKKVDVTTNVWETDRTERAKGEKK